MHVLERTAAIESFCETEGIELVGKLPYDMIITEAMVQGQPVTCPGRKHSSPQRSGCQVRITLG